jgi:hypothetical protein
MTPKEKANELYQKYYNNYGYYGIPVDAVKHSKQCANICIDEIINEYDTNICYCGYDNDFEMWNDKKQFWIDVKQELELL